MSQLVRDFDFGIGSEASRRLAAGTGVVQFNLEHDGLLLMEGMDPMGRRTLTRISRATNEIVLLKQTTEPEFGACNA